MCVPTIFRSGYDHSFTSSFRAAIALGLIARRLTAQEILRQRRLPWRYELGDWLERCYFAKIPTRRLPSGRSHALIYAT